MSESAAPDYAEAFEAWRVWKVVRRDGEFSLASVIHRTVWPAGEVLTAACLRPPRLFPRLRRGREHEAPEVECDCGIYAAALERLGQYITEAPCPLWRYGVPIEALASRTADAPRVLAELRAAV